VMLVRRQHLRIRCCTFAGTSHTLAPLVEVSRQNSQSDPTLRILPEKITKRRGLSEIICDGPLQSHRTSPMLPSNAAASGIGRRAYTLLLPCR